MYENNSHTSIESFLELLNNCKCEDKSQVTHTAFPGGGILKGGKWKIVGDDYINFINMYSDIVFGEVKSNEGKRYDINNIVERHSTYSPIVIDIDVKYSSNSNVRGYNVKDIQYVVMNYMKVIEKYIKVEKESERFAFVLEKTQASLETDGLYKDGVHIYFPNIIAIANVKHLIREDFIKQLPKDKLFRHIKVENTIEDIFDKSVVSSNGMLLYGSKKPHQKGRGYRLQKLKYVVYPDKIDFIDISFSNQELLKLFTLQKNCDQASTLVSGIDVSIDTMLQKNIVENKDYPPQTVSESLKKKTAIENYEKYYNLKKGSVKITQVAESIAGIDGWYKHKVSSSETKKKKIVENIGHIKPTENVARLKLARDLVDILKPDRVDSYDSWYKLGLCLHSISRNLDIDPMLLKEWKEISPENKSPSDFMLDQWINISKKSPKFVEGECNKLWYNMDMLSGGLTIHSLHYWARQDNLYKYNRICKKSIDTELPNILQVKDGKVPSYDLAKIVKLCFGDIFACVSIKKNSWYSFKDHSWKECHEGSELRNLLSEQIRTMIGNYRTEYSSQQNRYESEGNKDYANMYESRMNNCIKLHNKLGESGYKDQVMKELCELFYDSKFMEKLDSNVNLFAFENGVYDLENKVFRHGRPSDYISFSSKINYIDYTPDSSEIKQINTFLDQVLPIPDVKEYVITLLSTFISGKTGEEKFHIWTGSGGNGKSKLIDLFAACMGDYKTTLPISLLTQKRGSSSGASPELEKTKGKRFACLQEPERNEKLNVGLMKELTGGDTIEARGLYKEPIHFKPQFKLVLTCNDLPEMPSDDEGTWRRVRAVEFPSKFTEKPDPSIPYQFPIDTELISKFDGWKEPFMSMLIHYYITVYSGKGLFEPKEVTQRTNEYQKDNDINVEFLENNCVIEVNEQGSVPWSTVNSKFKKYLKETSNNKKSAQKCKDLKLYMEKLYGKLVHHKWNGISIKSDDSTEESDEEGFHMVN